MTRILFLTTFLALPGAALAVPMTWLADSALDEPDAVPGDGFCVSTPSAVCTLRAAIDEANFNPDHDEIVLIVSPAITRPGIDNTNFNGDLDVDLTGGTDALIIMGMGANATVIDANQHDRVFDVHGAGHFELRDVGVAAGFTEANGGGIRINGAASVTLERVSVEGNEAEGSGGGLYAAKNVIDIRDSTFAYNTSYAEGGGMYVSGDVTQTNVTVSTNAAASGGGITYFDGAMSLDHVTITQNDASLGGGLQTVWGNVTLTNSIVGDNLLGGAPGPGLFTQDCVVTAGGTLHYDWSMLTTGAGCAFTFGVAPVPMGLNIPPMLNALAYNAGGTTLTHMPVVPGPAGASPADGNANPVPSRRYDQNGTLRNQTVGPDMGACEN